MVATTLIILFWVIAVLAGLIILGSLHDAAEKGRPDVRGLVIGVVFAFVAGFIRTREPVQWSLAEGDGSRSAYNEYARDFPDGAHATEAHARLQELDARFAEARPAMLRHLASRGRATGLGGRILATLTDDRAESAPALGVRTNVNQWPAEYPSQETRNQAEDALELFVTTVGADLQTVEQAVPPFPVPTVVIELSAQQSGNYRLEGGMLGQAVPGIAITASILFYRSGQKTAESPLRIGGSPEPDLRFKKRAGDTFVSEEQMRTVITYSASVRLADGLRDALAISEINSLAPPKP